MRLRYAGLFTAFFILTLANVAPALSFSFRDLSETSPNGRYTLTAKSSHNLDPDDPKHTDLICFEYVLNDNSTGEALFRRIQPITEPPPCKLFVHDDGTSIVRAHVCEIHVLDTATGAIALRLDQNLILSRRPPVLRYDYGEAVPHWSHHSRWHFFEHDGRLYFAVDLLSNEAWLIDVAERALVESPSEALLDALALVEKRQGLELLQRAAKLEEGFTKENASWWWGDVRTAMFFAGREGWPEAIPLLRTLERIEEPHKPRVQGTVSLQDACGVGEFRASLVEEFNVRQIAQVALGRLGLKRVVSARTRVFVINSDFQWWEIEAPELPAPRGQRVDLIVPGLLVRDVIAALGPPDDSFFADWPALTRRTWRYWLDEPEPRTLDLVFDDESIVTGIQWAPPPDWLAIPASDP